MLDLQLNEKKIGQKTRKLAYRHIEIYATLYSKYAQSKKLMFFIALALDAVYGDNAKIKLPHGSRQWKKFKQI